MSVGNISKADLAKWFGIATLASFMTIVEYRIATAPWDVSVRGEVQVETLLVVLTGTVTAVIAWFGFSKARA